MKMYDITRPVSPEMAVWPGDESVEFKWTARIGPDSPVNIGCWKASTHAGTHVDAPLHYETGGQSVDELSLETFVGPAAVVDVGHAASIGLEHVGGLPETTRVLFKSTCSSQPGDSFSRVYPHLTPEVVEHLAERGCVLIGTDAPSVDPFDSRTLPAHHTLARCGIVPLENLMLRGVEPGMYRLIALPLRLAGLDASPVRAMLTE